MVRRRTKRTSWLSVIIVEVGSLLGMVAVAQPNLLEAVVGRYLGPDAEFSQLTKLLLMPRESPPPPSFILGRDSGASASLGGTNMLFFDAPAASTWKAPSPITSSLAKAGSQANWQTGAAQRALSSPAPPNSFSIGFLPTLPASSQVRWVEPLREMPPTYAPARVDGFSVFSNRTADSRSLGSVSPIPTSVWSVPFDAYR